LSHISPDRWADVAEGRVEGEELVEMLAHAESCPQCAGGRARVEAARATIALVRGSSPRMPAAEQLGARVYWSASMEMRQQRRRLPRRRWLAPVAALGFAVAGAAVAVLAIHSRSSPPIQEAVAKPEREPERLVPPAAPAPVASLVTFLQGDVRHNFAQATSRSILSAGDVIETGAGRVAVQFGARSGVLVEPHSRLEVVAWDERVIVLRVAGAAGFELAPRAAGQRFAVLAGDRTVEVRGTRFRVAERAGDLDVAVEHGRVEIIEGAGHVPVDAGARLAVARGARVGAPGEVLSEPAQQALAESLRLPLLPTWSDDAGELRQPPPMLAITAPAKLRVRVDGVEVGRGSFQLRVASGRHLVEAAGTARWVDVEDSGEPPAVVLGTGRSERPSQVDAQLVTHRAAVAQCAAAERKAAPGFAGQIEVEIGIAVDGSVSFVAPVGRSPHVGVERCILGLVRDRFTFPRGTQATVRKAIAF